VSPCYRDSLRYPIGQLPVSDGGRSSSRVFESAVNYLRGNSILTGNRVGAREWLLSCQHARFLPAVARQVFRELWMRWFDGGVALWFAADRYSRCRRPWYLLGCPLAAEADMTPLGGGSGFDPQRTYGDRLSPPVGSAIPSCTKVQYPRTCRQIGT
jgi:hypothetical protein